MMMHLFYKVVNNSRDQIKFTEAQFVLDKQFKMEVYQVLEN